MKKGINLTIDFNPISSDEKDGDIDFETKIAPNTDKQKGQTTYKLNKPPKGKAIIVKRINGNERHYQVFLSTGNMYDLWIDPQNNNQIFLKKTPLNKIDANDHVTVSVSDKGVNDFTTGEFETMNRNYKKMDYVKYKLDCFSFIMDLLNNKLKAKLEPEITESSIRENPAYDPNEHKFENIKEKNNE